MSLADLFERHHAAVFGYLSRRVPRASDAEDLAQDVFLRAQRTWSRYDERGQEAAWLFRIARNVLLNFRRDASRQPRLGSAEGMEDLAPAASSAPDGALDLQRHLAGLPEQEAEAFLLREVAGLGYDEIAAATGASPDAVRNRIFRARRALREAMSPSRPRAVPSPPAKIVR